MMNRSRGRSSSDRAYIEIRDKIITTALKPGERISEKALSEEFGISRTPIREALMRLRYDGFVDILAQRGTYVTPIHLDVVRAAHYSRSVLECALVRDAALRCSEREARALWENLEQQQLIADQGSGLYRIEGLDETLHQQLAGIAGQPSLWQVIYPVQLHINRVRTLFLSSTRVPEIIREHDAIIRAVTRHDAEAAQAAMQTHLEYMENNIERLADSYSEYLS
ncbi:GntR family transcriptional regulator [Kushneria sinocarnis]|uniref:GntR family transcriptional regulator n=1 Tax=Kushneria sinocarnis TaxID=595502 RepID=A0A420X1R6_9GAMM|nr:GntR family transcriptional regulator [Kushneria sinocarnis]RKR07649.1 GntR family transcriptional regulator [Kushneria sinocarnis]